MLGYRVDDIEGSEFARLLRPSDAARLKQVVAGVGDAYAGGGSETHVIECALEHRDGTWLQFEVQYADLLQDEHVRGIVLNSRDVSERKAFEDQLAHQAFHDPVTKLANRALFSDRVQHALPRTTRGGPTVGVMFIDLDDFKTVNDSLGHAAGDAVLQEVAVRLLGTVRPGDTVARFGGDEFAVLLDGVEDSQRLPNRGAVPTMRSSGSSRSTASRCIPARVSVSASSAAELGSPDAEELLRNADVAMYMAKRDSKGSYRVFEPAMHERALERLELQAELQQALELNQLEVHYQPIVRLHRTTPYGVEALLRWIHPTRGNITPDSSCRSPRRRASSSRSAAGSCTRRAVRRRSCTSSSPARFRSTSASTSRSSNCSPRRSSTTSAAALETNGLQPSTLMLEITETVMMADTDLADAAAQGPQVARSSPGDGRLRHWLLLAELPQQIPGRHDQDGSLVPGVRAHASGLAAAIIALGENLDLEVVAEGIELPEQTPSLRNLSCEFGQGFLFAEPMGNHALLEYLVSGGGRHGARRRDECSIVTRRSTAPAGSRG